MSAMITPSENAMFIGFDSVHEKPLVAVLNNMPFDMNAKDSALRALAQCQSRIIDALKEVGATQRRGELKVLYDGLCLANEFIKQFEVSND